MIIGSNRIAVIKNIKEFAEQGDFYKKVEVDDPDLSAEQSKTITDGYINNRDKITYRLKSALAVTLVKILTKIINKDTEIVGLENIPANLDGVIITSNHFGPLENTVIRHLTNAMGRKNLNIISQTSNFAMKGIIGFIMNYTDTIPISMEPRYLARDFMEVLREKLVEKKNAVLLYPEQEMWFNYRKPRPPKNGAYFYAAKLDVPVLSCFVEIVDKEKQDTPEFKKTKYILHILGTLYPDKEKSARENADFLGNADYKLKKECYERVYGKALDYKFDKSDIAGFVGDIDE